MSRTRRIAVTLLVPVAVAAAGCSSEASTQGIEEPVRVIGGQFVAGEMPGLPPVRPGEPEVFPRITTAQAGGQVDYGDPKRDITGRASDDAVSVAFGFVGLGSGYWVVPVTSRDASNPDELSFDFTAEFSRSIPAGVHRVRFAAINTARAAGTQFEVEFCRTSEVPDNGNACNPAVSPPSLVVSLGWDREVDLDLQVLTPDGVLVDTKHRNTAADEDGALEPNVGTLGIDSNASCVLDRIRRENLVFQQAPPPGAYYVYANLFDACGEDSVRFTASLHAPSENSETGEFDQIETHRTSGVLVASQANGGASVGLLLTSFVVP